MFIGQRTDNRCASKYQPTKQHQINQPGAYKRLHQHISTKYKKSIWLITAALQT